MKAAFISQPGDASQFQINDVETPKSAAGEVLVRLEMAALNHVDIWVRSGSPAYSVSFPHICGADGAGIVESIGPDGEGVSVGDRVVVIPGLSCGLCSFCLKGLDNQCDKFEILGAKRPGTYATHVVVPDQNVVVIPETLSFEEAAAYPLAYLTAWHMLLGRARLVPQEKVLIVGASAGIAVAAIQLAKAKGASVLAATTNEAKAQKIKSIGADEVFVQDGKKDLSKWVMEQTANRGVDVVFEHVGPATWTESLKSLRKYGRLVTCGATSGPVVSLELRALFGRDITVLGARMGTKKEFQELSQLVGTGKIKPIIDKIFPLDQVADAHRRMEAREQIGKILLKTS